MIPGMVPRKLAHDLIIRLLENFERYPIKTAAGFRNAVLDGMFAVNPLIDMKEDDRVNMMIDAIRQTILEGRMIDFGFIPNQMIIDTSIATRDVFEAGELVHPYDRWIAVSSWEGGMCGYFFADTDDENPAIIAVEIYGVALPGLPLAVLVNDGVSIDISDGTTRIQPVTMLDPELDEELQLQRRGANLLDPLVCFLRILSDASVPVIDHPAPLKLNRQRVKHGKTPIPPHSEVLTHDYVSQVAARSSRRTQGDGTGRHASPVAHWRRAHKRRLPDGHVIPVRSSRVNWRDGEEIHRLFSRVKQETGHAKEE